MASARNPEAAATDGLPDAAAQAVLAQLNPLMVPPPVPWTPQTAGWAVLAVLLLLVAGWAAWRGWRRWQAARHRRLALAELQRLRRALGAPGAATAERTAAARQLPELVRRLALAHAPRAEIAPLQGTDWAEWLDRTLGDEARPFTRGAGRLLADCAYRPDDALPWREMEPLLVLVERWIRQHRAAETVR